MRAIPRRRTFTEARGDRARRRGAPASRVRPGLITEAVVAGYIHDISERRHGSSSPRVSFADGANGIRTRDLLRAKRAAHNGMFA